MFKSARQSMAWLHSWLGLLLGGFLFCIFLTGSLTYYRQEINLWSQPTLTTINVQQEQAIQHSFQYLQQNAVDAKSWFIEIATSENPINKIYWKNQDNHFEYRNLHPNTNQEIKFVTQPAGDFFYLFHFQLYGMPYYVGRLIVSFSAFIMLICLISGIIIHKKIFTDFFTLRTFKGARSYLDIHNISSVIALPFFLTITFTGLAIFFYLYFPKSLNHFYPNNYFQYFEEITTIHQKTKAQLKPAKMLNFDHIQKKYTQNLGDFPIGKIQVNNPNTPSATITLTALQDNSITRNAPHITFNFTNGETLSANRNMHPVATLNNGVYGLHMAKFAQPLLRLSLFFSGLLGCLMIASGILLWSLKRQIKATQKFHFGHFLVNRFNITVLIGLPISILSYFIFVRSTLFFTTSQNIEIQLFFSIWLTCFLFSTIIPIHKLWRVFLMIYILLSGFLLSINAFYIIHKLSLENFTIYWKFIRFDIFVFGFLMIAIFLYRHIEPIKNIVLIQINKKSKTNIKDKK